MRRLAAGLRLWALPALISAALIPSALISAVLASTVLPVQAQELVYDSAVTGGCTDALSSLPEKRSCIGASARACMAATPQGQTTVGTGTCLTRELDYWDARLNAVYGGLVARAKRIDAEFAVQGFNQPSLLQSLRAAQRAWIAWRDTTCAFERAQWGNGTGGGPAALSCHLHMTAEQALYLEFTVLGE